MMTLSHSFAFSMNSAVECCPIWDFDELNYRGELEEAANGYKESTTTSFVDVNFFDFFDLSHTKPTFEPQIPDRAHRTTPRSVPQQLQHQQQQQVQQQHQQQLQVQNVAAMESEEDSNNSIDAPSPVERTPKKKDSIKKQTTITMKLGLKSQDDQPKMRSPSSKTMEPISPTNPQMRGRKRKRVLQKNGGVSLDGDYTNDDSQSSSMDDSPNPQKKRRKNSNGVEGGQTECCVKDCHGSVTNRLRFSLRGTNDEDFKADFLKRDWQKICSKCYFRNFYKNKKR